MVLLLVAPQQKKHNEDSAHSVQCDPIMINKDEFIYLTPKRDNIFSTSSEELKNLPQFAFDWESIRSNYVNERMHTLVNNLLPPGGRYLISHSCHLKCPYCLLGGYGKGFASINQIEQFIKLQESRLQNGSKGVLELLGGEPLIASKKREIHFLFQNWVNRVETYLEDSFIRVFSNGIDTKHFVDLLNEFNVKTTISLGKDRIFKNGTSSFPLVVENLLHLVKEGYSPDLNFVISEPNQQILELTELLQTVPEITVCNIFLTPIITNAELSVENYSNLLMSLTNNIETLLNVLDHQQDQRLGIGMINGLQIILLKRRIYLTANQILLKGCNHLPAMDYTGKILVCDRDFYGGDQIIGNFIPKYQMLPENELRKQLLRHSFQLTSDCQTCPQQDICFCCPALPILNTSECSAKSKLKAFKHVLGQFLMILDENNFSLLVKEQIGRNSFLIDSI